MQKAEKSLAHLVITSVKYDFFYVKKLTPAEIETLVRFYTVAYHAGLYSERAGSPMLG